jgi:hypothetical protein
VDRLGSVIAITGSDGVVQERMAYDSWGKRRNLANSGTPDTLDGVKDNKGGVRNFVCAGPGLKFSESRW